MLLLDVLSLPPTCIFVAVYVITLFYYMTHSVWALLGILRNDLWRDRPAHRKDILTQVNNSLFVSCNPLTYYSVENEFRIFELIDLFHWKQLWPANVNIDTNVKNANKCQQIQLCLSGGIKVFSNIGPEVPWSLNASLIGSTADSVKICKNIK